MLRQKLMGGAGVEPVYVEELFQTHLYTGNGSTQTITNGIDLAGEGGLVWTKGRSTTTNNLLVDTVRGGNRGVYSNSDSSQSAGFSFTFNDNGYSTGSYVTSGVDYVSWTFRKAAKFFDVVTNLKPILVSTNLESEYSKILFSNSKIDIDLLLESQIYLNTNAYN